MVLNFSTEPNPCPNSLVQAKHDPPVARLRLNICTSRDKNEAGNSDRLKL